MAESSPDGSILNGHIGFSRERFLAKLWANVEMVMFRKYVDDMDQDRRLLKSSVIIV